MAGNVFKKNDLLRCSALTDKHSLSLSVANIRAVPTGHDSGVAEKNRSGNARE